MAEEQLPRFSFKRYISTSNVYSVNDLLEHIISFAKENSARTDEDTGYLAVVTIYPEEEGYIELRVWVLQGKIILLARGTLGDVRRLHKAVIEEFSVNPLVAAYEIDSATHLGFEPIIIKADSLDELHRALEGLLAGAQPSGEPQAGTGEAVPATGGPGRLEPSISRRDTWIEILWDLSLSELQVMDIGDLSKAVKMLRDGDSILMGKHTSYLIVIKKHKNCKKYLVKTYLDGTTTTRCIEDAEEVIEELSKFASQHGLNEFFFVKTNTRQYEEATTSIQADASGHATATRYSNHSDRITSALTKNGGGGGVRFLGFDYIFLGRLDVEESAYRYTTN